MGFEKNTLLCSLVKVEDGVPEADSHLLLVALTIANEGLYPNLETAIPCLLILVSTLGLLRHHRNETQ